MILRTPRTPPLTRDRGAQLRVARRRRLVGTPGAEPGTVRPCGRCRPTRTVPACTTRTYIPRIRFARPVGVLIQRSASAPNRALNLAQPVCGSVGDLEHDRPDVSRVPAGRFSAERSRSRWSWSPARGQRDRSGSMAARTRVLISVSWASGLAEPVRRGPAAAGEPAVADEPFAASRTASSTDLGARGGRAARRSAPVRRRRGARRGRRRGAGHRSRVGAGVGRVGAPRGRRRLHGWRQCRPIGARMLRCGPCATTIRPPCRAGASPSRAPSATS